MVRNNNLVIAYNALTVADALEALEEGKPIVWRDPLTTAQIKEHIVQLDKAQNHNIIPRLITNAKLYRDDVEITGAADAEIRKAFASYQTHVLQKLIKLPSHSLPSLEQFLDIMHRIERDIEAQKKASSSSPKNDYPPPSDMMNWAQLNALIAAKLIKIRGGGASQSTETTNDNSEPTEGQGQPTETTAGDISCDESTEGQGQPPETTAGDISCDESTDGQGQPTETLDVDNEPIDAQSQPGETTADDSKPSDGQDQSTESAAAQTDWGKPTGGWGESTQTTWGDSTQATDGANAWQAGDASAQAPAATEAVEAVPPEETGVVPVEDIPTYELSIDQIEKAFRHSYTPRSPDSPNASRSCHEWLGEKLSRGDEIVPHSVDLGGPWPLEHRPLRPEEHSLVRESTVSITGAENLRHPSDEGALVLQGSTRSDWTLDPFRPLPSSTIPHEPFILHSQSAREYDELVQSYVEKANSDEDMEELIGAFHYGVLCCEPDSFGAQWFRAIGQVRRQGILRNLGEISKDLPDFEDFKHKGNPSSSYDDSDKILMPPAGPPELGTSAWAATQWTSSEAEWTSETQRPDRHFSTTRNFFYNQLQHLVDTTADDIPFTPQEVDRWYTTDRKALDGADAFSNKYGVTQNSTETGKKYIPIQVEKPVAELDAAELDEIEDDDGFKDEKNSSNESVMLGQSFEYGCIVLADQGQPEFLTTYALADLLEVGNTSEGRLVTNVSFVAKPYQKPVVHIRHSCIVKDRKITFLEAMIPMHKLLEEPWYDQIDGTVLGQTWTELGRPLGEGNVPAPAWRVHLRVGTDSIEFREHQVGRRQLAGAGVPNLETEISRIMHGYRDTKQVSLIIYICQVWRDFETWAGRLAKLFRIGQSNELADLTKKVEKGCIIEPHTVNMELPSITTQVDAKVKFESAEEHLTWLSDIASREQRHAELLLEEATAMPLKIILIPVGTKYVTVKDVGGKEHKVSYLWQLVVTRASNMQRLLEILPPPGTELSFHIAIPIAKYTVPAQLKPEAELIAEEILSQMSRVVPGPDKNELIEIMAIISQYVKVKENPTEEDELYRNNFLAHLAKLFRKVRPTGYDNTAEAGESTEKHRARVTKAVDSFWKKGAFIMPPRATNAPTTWRGIRQPLDGPLSEIAQLSAIVRLPHVPNWPKGIPDRPFVLPAVPALPKRDCTVDAFVYKLRAKLGDVALDGNLAYSIDTKTIECRIKGLKAYDQVKHKRAYKWLREFDSVPVTMDVFKLYPLLGSVLTAYLAREILGGSLDDSDEQTEMPFAPLEYDEQGDPLAWTTEEYQRRQRDLVDYYANQLVRLDEGQREFFFSFSKLPFGYAFLQGCAGAGKSTIMNMIASIMQASHIDRRNLTKFLHEATPPAEEEKPVFGFQSDLRMEQVVEFPEGEEKVIPRPPVAPLEGDFQPLEEHMNDDQDGFTDGFESPPTLAGIDTPLIVGIPPLPFGPSVDQVIEDPGLALLKIADEPQQWLDMLRDNIRERYIDNLREHAHAYSEHVKAEFMNSTLALHGDRQRLGTYVEVLKWNMMRWWSEREHLFEQWWHKVLLAIFYIDDESNDDQMPAWEAIDLDSDDVLFDPELFSRPDGESEDNDGDDQGEVGEAKTEDQPAAEDVPDFAALQKEDEEASQAGTGEETPEQSNENPPEQDDTPPPADEPAANTYQQDGVEFVRPDNPPQEQQHESEKKKKLPEGHDFISGAKGLCCVVRNDSAEHNAYSLKAEADKAGLTPMGTGLKTIYKVNSMEATIGSLVNEYRTRRQPNHPFYEDDDLTASERMYLGMHGGLYEDFARKEGQFDPDARLRGGIYRLDARVRALMKHNKYSGLRALLEMEGDPNAPVDPKRTSQIRTALTNIIKKLLRNADWVICTDVVAVELADKHLYRPDIILFDEAALHPETDTMMVNMHHPTAYVRIYGGDHHQGMIFLLSGNLAVFNTTTTRLHQKKKYLRVGRDFVLGEDGLPLEFAWEPEQEDNTIFRADPTYRTKDEEAGGAQPGTRIWRMSELRRTAICAPQYVTNLNINHRSKAMTHEIAAAIAYDGKMQSSWNPNTPDQVVHALHEYLWLRTVNGTLKRDSEDSPKELVPHTNCLTIYNDGLPSSDGSSRTNTSQVRIALDEAAKIHQAGLCGYDGKLLRIVILTPYNAALQQIRTQMRRMSYEMCIGRVQASTIDSYQGNECDVVIIAWVADAKGGFLHEPQKLLVASTRAVLCRIDIMHPGLVTKRGQKWWHFRKMGEITDKNGAGLQDSRNWTVIDPKTYLPQDTASVADMACFFCRVTGHHTRNCPRRKEWAHGSSLNEDPALNYTPPQPKQVTQYQPKTKAGRTNIIPQGDDTKRALVQQLTQSMADFNFGSIDEHQVTKFLDTDMELQQDWLFDKAQAEEDRQRRQEEQEQKEEESEESEEDDGREIIMPRPKLTKQQKARQRKRDAGHFKKFKTSDITTGTNTISWGGDKKGRPKRKKDDEAGEQQNDGNADAGGYDAGGNDAGWNDDGGNGGNGGGWGSGNGDQTNMW